MFEALKRFVGLSGQVIETSDINLTILYAGHQLAGDLKGLKPKLKDVDLYIPESVGWPPKGLSAMRAMSAQRHSNVVPSRDPYMMGLFKILNGSGMPVALADLPEGHRLVNDMKHLDHKHVMGHNKFLSIPVSQRSLSDYQRLIEGERTYAHRFDVINDKREDELVAGFPKVMKEAKSWYPQLAKKDRPEVLMTIGFAHAPRLTNIFEDAGYQVTTFGEQDMNKMPYSWELSNRPGDSQEIETERMEKVLAELLFTKPLLRKIDTLIQDTAEQGKCMRKVFSQFPVSYIRDSWMTFDKDVDISEMFDVGIKATGISLPKNRTGLLRFIED